MFPAYLSVLCKSGRVPFGYLCRRYCRSLLLCTIHCLTIPT